MTTPPDKPPVVAFVAKSGTGKTTFLEKLIPQLKARGLRLGVLKHHAHSVPFDVPGKDSYRFSQAGADVVVGVCAVQVAVFYQEDGAADLDGVIARHLSGMDLVLAEGFKHGRHPKIEVCRAAYNARTASGSPPPCENRGLPQLLCQPEELLAVVTDCPVEADVPQFDLEDAAGVADFLVGWLRRRGGAGVTLGG